MNGKKETIRHVSGTTDVNSFQQESDMTIQQHDDGVLCGLIEMVDGKEGKVYSVLHNFIHAIQATLYCNNGE